MAEDDRPVGDKSTITATQWEAAALASALLTGGFAFFGILWMIGWIGGVPETADALRARAQVFTAGFASLAAIVTFCTVAWRAKVTERQASAQERQLESADENNLAILLQKGAELLSDEDEGKVAAGIACLEAVVTAENRRFGTQAMNLLAKYVERRHQQNHENHLCMAAISAIDNGKKNDWKCTVSIVFTGTDDTKWRAIHTGAKVSYSSGSFVLFSVFTGDDSKYYRFENVKFRYANFKIQIFLNFNNCIFIGCGFEYVNTSSFSSNTFEDCDFSGTKFTKGHLADNFDFTRSFPKENCYFYEDDPPYCEDEAFLAKLRLAIDCRDPDERDAIPF